MGGGKKASDRDLTGFRAQGNGMAALSSTKSNATACLHLLKCAHTSQDTPFADHTVGPLTLVAAPPSIPLRVPPAARSESCQPSHTIG